MLLTGIAGVRGKLPGVEPAPYIIRFTEDRPNPLYRRVCYTFAWSAAITFALLNIAGLVVAIVTGQWYLKQIYRYAYFPIAGTIWLLGAFGRLPRVMASTKGEGHERRYFYGTVWAMCLAQPALWLMWYVLPNTASGTRSSSRSFWESWRLSAILRVWGACRARDPSFPASSRFRTRLATRLCQSSTDDCLICKPKRSLKPSASLKAGKAGTTTQISTTGKMRRRSTAAT